MARQDGDILLISKNIIFLINIIAAAASEEHEKRCSSLLPKHFKRAKLITQFIRPRV